MSLIVRLVITVALVLLSASSWAQLSYYTLIDADNDAATGCTVVLPTAGTVAGVERRLTATVSETATPQVVQLTLESCASGSFGTPVALPGVPYPVGSNNGAGRADAVEQAVSASAIAAPGAPVRLYFAAQGPTSDDLLGATSGPPILLDIQPGDGPADIPFLSGWGSLALALFLLVAVFRHRSHLPASVVGLLLVGTLAGIAWAAGFRLDGQVGDWQGVSAVGSDAQGDSAPNTDIVTAFAAQEGGNLFFRTDIANAETTPSSNRAPSFASTAITTANVASPYSYAITTSDPDGNALTLTAPTLPAWLTFTPGANGAGTLSGTPSPANAGPHAVVLRVTDNGTPNLSTDQAFTITVGAATNPAPVLDLNGPAAGIDFSATFTEGGSAAAVVDPLSLTVIDPDSPNLISATVTLTNLLDAGQETLAVNSAAPITASYDANTGILTLTGSAPVAQYQTVLRTVTYSNAAAAPTATPARVITFIVSDGVNTSAPATATVTLTGVNDAPSFTKGPDQTEFEDAGPQTVTGWATAISAGPPDEAGQTLTFNVTGNSNPSLFAANPAVSSDGTLTYTPAANANGSANITLTLSDSGGTDNGGQDTSAPQTFTITVTAVNDEPSFTASNQTVNENAGARTVTGWATFNPGNPQESTQTVLAYTVSNVTNSALFSVGAQPTVDTSGTLRYTPAAGAFGTSDFSVQVQDNGGTTNGGDDTSTVQTFSITVNAVDDPPTAVNDAATVTEDSGATAINVLANDTDPDGGPISVTSVTPPANGTVVITGGGTGLAYQPNADYCNSPPGTTLDTFTYTLTPGGSTATVTVAVTCVDDNPLAVADSATVTEDSGANPIDVLANDTDPDGGPIGIISVTPPANGTVVITGGGTGLTYQPNADYCNSPPGSALDSFGYTLTPGGSSTTVTVTVTCLNDPPVLTLPGPAAAYDTANPVPIDPTATVSDIDSPDFDTGTVQAQVTEATCDANDLLTVNNQGVGAGRISVSGNDIFFGATPDQIGTITSDFLCDPNPPGSGNTLFTITLNAKATPAAVQALVQNLAFSTSGAATPARVVEITVTDGDGGTSNTATKTVNIDAAPTVSTIVPANNATGVAIDADVLITFSEDVTAPAAAFAISCATSGNHPFALSGGPASFTLDPNTDFANGEVCTVTVTATQVSDQDSNDPPDNMTTDFTSTFTTVDAAPTVLASSAPANAAVVATTQTVTLNFSEAVNVVPANITLNCGAAVAFTNSSASNVTSITLTPNSPLAAGANCTLNVPVTAATDADTVDPPDELGAAFNRSFSVDAVPTVTTTAPTNGATNVPTNSNITVNFSENVNVVNASFTIACPTAQTFVATGTGTGSITLDPTVDLPGGTTCTVTVVAANVTDADVIDPPNNMAANFVFSFGTAAAANDDAYTVTPHLTYVSPAGVRGNDNPTNITITGFGSTLGTANGTVPNGTNFITAGGAGGRVILNADGTFTLWPDAGDTTATGTATFFYTIAGGDTAQVTLTFEAEELVWFVDNSPASPVCTGANVGTQACPAATLGAVSGVDTAGDTIFVASGNYACGITLEANERLVGDGSSSNLATLSSVTPVTGSDFAPYNTFSGTRPVLTSGAACITLASNNTLRGFNLSNTGGTALVGNNFGNLVVAETSVSNSNGAAINLNTGNPTATFTSVSANGGTNGISLTSTTGSFAVTGTGGLCSAATPTCTGGTISNVTDTGVKLTNASNITLTRMRVQNSPNFGLNGSTVNTMNIDTCLFDGTHGSAIDEGAIFVTNWFGSGTISNSEITGGFNDNVRVNNTTSGTLNRLTVSNTTIRNSGNNHGFAFYGCLNGSSGSCPATTMNLSVLNSTFIDNSSNSVNASLASTTSSDVVLQGNVFQSTSQVTVGGPGGSVLLAIDHSSTMTLDVNGNTFINPRLSAFTASISNQTLAAASMVGKIRTNIIGVSGDDLSGSRQGSGMLLTATGAAAMTLNVTGNTIRNWATNNGIDINSGDGVNGSPNVNLTITGNTLHLDSPTTSQLHGIGAVMGTTSDGGAVNACVDIGGTGLQNIVTGSIGSGVGSEIRVRQRFASNVRLPGFPGPNNNGSTSETAAITYLQGRNTGAPNTTVTVNATGALGTGTFTGGAACTQAP